MKVKDTYHYGDLHQALQQALVVNSPDSTQQQVEILSITYIRPLAKVTIAN